MPQAIERLFATPMMRPRLPARMPGAVESAMNHPVSARKRGFFIRGAGGGKGKARGFLPPAVRQAAAAVAVRGRAGSRSDGSF